MVPFALSRFLAKRGTESKPVVSLPNGARTLKPFYLYILRCRDGSYYVGHTDDLEKRMVEHAEGLCGGYTARRRPVEPSILRSWMNSRES